MRIFLYTILFFANLCIGQTANYLTSFTFAKSFAMGGAATGSVSGLESTLYNPAAKHYSDVHHVNVYLNPVSTYLALNDMESISKRNDYSPLQWLSYAGLYAKALSYVSSSFQVNLMLNEELPQNPYRKKLADPEINGILDWHFHTLSSSIRLAEQVSVGASLFAFNTKMPQDSMKYELGACYSILMKPTEKFSAGITYFSLPETVDSVFFDQFHLGSETINIGISYRPASFVNLALDVRNVSEQSRKATLEVHAGTEFTLFPYLHLRAGYAEYVDTNEQCFTAGIGFGARRTFSSVIYPRFFDHLRINYAIQRIDFQNDCTYQHFLTFLIKL